MMIMSRNTGYPELLEVLNGKKVTIWTCNTCARFCHGIGGNDAAERLASKLRDDGVEVSGVFSTSASCIEDKVAAKKKDVAETSPELILALTCNIGASCAGRFFGKEVLNPIDTMGTGYLTENGEPILVSEGSVKKATDLSDNVGPFI